MERIHTKGVSIIICTYNGKDRLGSTLDYIQKIQFDLPWELVFVDNASKDKTIDFVSEYLMGTGLDYRLLSCPTPGKNYALWMAFKNCQYEYVLICDDDNHLFSNYLTIGFQVLEANSQIGALGGQGLIPLSFKFPEWLIPFKKAFAIGPQGKTNGRIPDFAGLYGAGCFFRKEALNKLIEIGYTTVLTSRKGDAKLSSGGDTELCHAVQELGYELWYNESLKFYHAIEEERLTKDYFIKLKISQAANFPILEVYRFKQFENFDQFKTYLKKKHLENIKMMVLAYLSFLKNKTFTKRVQKEVYRTLVNSYYNNIKLTLQTFETLVNAFSAK